MTKTLRLYAKEFTSKEGRKFLSYSAKIGDIWYKIKFRRECEDYPRRAGTYSIKLNSEECSFQQSENGFNDIIWVKSVLELNRIETLNKSNVVEDIFTAVPEDDSHPF